ncbi:hypothetical protein [Streptomyces phaeochromogenes]|uniref:hypothetical protein n=1 Tax=Streptomyces phaeochromogenes TaxID=1923 RepID=UPI0039A15ABA
MAWHLDGLSTGEIAEAMGLENAAVLQKLADPPHAQAAARHHRRACSCPGM